MTLLRGWWEREIEREKRLLLTPAPPQRKVWEPISSVILLFPIFFLQAQLILLGNRKQSLTGSKRAVLETIFAVKEGQQHVPD